MEDIHCLNYCVLCRQRILCRTFPDVMVSVMRGAKMGVRECQRQFRRSRWNCTTSGRDSTVFGKLMLQGTRSYVALRVSLCCNLYRIGRVWLLGCVMVVCPMFSYPFVRSCVFYGVVSCVFLLVCVLVCVMMSCFLVFLSACALLFV